MNFARVLEDVARFLDTQGARFGLAGAFALHAYGYARATADLDFVVEAKAQPVLCIHLESLGYQTIHRSAGYSNHVHPLPSLGRVDFIYLDEPTSHALFGGARRLEVLPGLQALVPRPEHLAAMKVLAMKNDPSRALQEMADIQFLLTVPGIDEEAVRSHFERHGLLEKFHEIKRTLSGP
jgi:hypothetical protein